MANDTHKLFCLIEGDTNPFEVTVSTGESISFLKEVIIDKRKNGPLRDVDHPAVLVLWQLNKSVPARPAKTLAERISHLGALSQFATELQEPVDSVLDVFPEQPLKGLLHIIVQKPLATLRPSSSNISNRSVDAFNQPSSKRPRLTSPTSNKLESLEPQVLQISQKKWNEFYNQLWGKGLEHFQGQYVRSETDDSGASFRIMKVHGAFNLRLNGLLVRDEWDITWDWAQKECVSGINNFIIVGQTGIGKTLSLYYFLAQRLALGLTTFFQNVPDRVWLFNQSGVRHFVSDIPWVEIGDISKDHPAWALVDSNRRVKDPAPVLIEHGSPFFIVEAASPHDKRWGWVKYHGNTRYFYQNPFSLNEILQGNSVQPQPSNKDDLRNFFIDYGPSARECYSATSSKSSLATYLEKVLRTVTRMSWVEINRLVTEADFIPKFDDDTSYLVVLIQPVDDARLKCYASIITRTILRHLWKAHRVELIRKSRELFHLFSRKRETSVTAGWLFEAIVHDMLEEGIDVPIDPMAVEQNNRANAVKHVASDISTKRWKSSTMEYVLFTQNDRALVIKPLHYYVPVDPSHPTYDSFTFELTPSISYEGPILNPKDKEVCDKAVLDKNSNIGLFTVFQVTTIAAEHDLNEKGLNYICVIADRNKLNAIGIRYIGIIPAGETRLFKIPVAWRGKLNMYSLPIAVYEPSVSPKQSVRPPLLR